MLKEKTEKKNQKNGSQKEAGTLVRKLGKAKQLTKHRFSPKMQVGAVKCWGRTWSHQEHACQQRSWKGKEEWSWCLREWRLLEARNWMRSLLADSKSASVLEKVSQDINSWVWYQFIASLREPDPLFLSCSFQHPETICTTLHMKALYKNHFFSCSVSYSVPGGMEGRRVAQNAPFYIRQHLNHAVRWVWPRSHWSQWVLLSKGTMMRLGLMLLRHCPVIVHTLK